MTFRLINLFFYICVFVFVFISPTESQTNKSESLNPHKLPNISRRIINLYFDKKQNLIQSEFANYKITNLKGGVFVTLSKNGKTRACWGFMHPQNKNLIQDTIQATLGALTKEYRYEPIKKSEIADLKVQVTIINSIRPIQSLTGQNALKSGLFLRAGNKSAVVLPGEALDAKYQLIMCQQKAGLKSGEKYQLYTLKAQIFKEKTIDSTI
jgi:AMMECR1 domain-containing protein